MNLTIDGQESMRIKYKDRIRIRRGKPAKFIRLSSESYFNTLREKLHWGEELENNN